jgi:glycosyltransferase involved in cell wall biosynthesis
LNPFVSVVVPTYNRLYALAELLESLSRQTYRHFEVIIVNDGGEHIERVATLYPELQMNVIHLENNVGHVEARNIGVKAAKGEFVMLCDDDLLLPCHMERMVAEMTDVDFVYSDVEIFHYKIDNGQRLPTKNFWLLLKEPEVAKRKAKSTVIWDGKPIISRLCSSAN